MAARRGWRQEEEGVIEAAPEAAALSCTYCSGVIEGAFDWAARSAHPQRPPCQQRRVGGVHRGACARSCRSPAPRSCRGCAGRLAPPAAAPSRRGPGSRCTSGAPSLHQRSAPRRIARPPVPARRAGRCIGQRLEAGEVFARQAVAGAVGQRQVEAPARQVHAQVLPEVDQLQRAADGVALRQRVGVVHAVQVQQQAPDRVGRARQ